MFSAGNPLDRECAFTIAARPVGRWPSKDLSIASGHGLYARRGGADFILLNDEGRPSEERFEGNVTLQPGESKRLLIGGQLPVRLGADEFAAVEVVQSCDERIVGSLGLPRQGERAVDSGGATHHECLVGERPLGRRGLRTLR